MHVELIDGTWVAYRQSVDFLTDQESIRNTEYWRAAALTFGIRSPLRLISDTDDVENVRRAAHGRDMMFQLKRFRLVQFFAGVFLLYGSLAWPGDGIISRVPDPSGSFCHLRFPAIREDTLFSDQPMLKEAGEGDILDAYGPCNFDPLGKESIVRQQRDYQLRTFRGYGRN